MNEKDLKQLNLDYKTTFRSESGERVLKDLKRDAALKRLLTLREIATKAHT